jgi:hypothetical protein
MLEDELPPFHAGRAIGPKSRGAAHRANIIAKIKRANIKSRAAFPEENPARLKYPVTKMKSFSF